jgi:DNA-directed RNA polymerase subunit H
VSEVPPIVKKTRALLALRGFSTEKYDEYEDRYAMRPTRETEKGLVKYVIWMFKEAKVIGVAIVRDIVKEMEETESQRGMLVGGSRFTPASKKFAKKSRVELVEGNYSSFDLFDHELVPMHIIAEDSEVQLVLDHFRIDKKQLPRIYASDPAARVLGARPGQVVRIERESPTAGKTYYYRFVVDA